MVVPSPDVVSLPDRVVEILSRRSAGAVTSWSTGSGFVVKDGLVLTSAHTLLDSSELIVRFRGAEERPATVCRLADGTAAVDELIDIAIVQISGPPLSHAPISFARLSPDAALGAANLEGCSAFGFPRFQEKVRGGRDRPVRESIRVDGYIPIGQDTVEGLATLRIRDAPHDAWPPAGSLDGSLWQGISGAVVFAGERAVGVISEHHPPAGTNGLTFVPLTWLDRRLDSDEWWTLLGVDDPKALPWLPADGVDQGASEELLDQYRRLLLRSPAVVRLDTPFGGLPSDFYMPRIGRQVSANSAWWSTETDPGSAPPRPPSGEPEPMDDVVQAVRRLVVVAPAGHGKTELLSEVARRLASQEWEGVPVPIRLSDLARRGEQTDLLTFAVEEAFRDILDRQQIERLAAALRSRLESDEIVFLFDGLDEVAAGQQPDLLDRVRRTSRFVLTSRPLGLVDALHGDVTVFQLDDLTDGAVERFIAQWAAHEPQASALLTAITEDPRTATLVQVPQLLTLMCWSWRSTSTIGRNRLEIIGNAIDQAFDRAVRLAPLAPGDEEVVPLEAREALQGVALESMLTDGGTRLAFSRKRLLDQLATVGGADRAGRLLALVRRTGLISAVSGAKDEFQFRHDLFRSVLAGAAVVTDDDPQALIDRLRHLPAAEDALAAAAAAAPEWMPEIILDRIFADPDLLGMSWRLAATCLEGLEDLSALQNRLEPIIDAVLAGSRRGWSSDFFRPALRSLRIPLMRSRLFVGLSADDIGLRQLAAEGLGVLGEVEAAPALIERLGVEDDPDVQWALVEALGRLQDKCAVEPVLLLYQQPATEDNREIYPVIGACLARLRAESELVALIPELGSDPAVVGHEPFTFSKPAATLRGALPFVAQPLWNQIAEALIAHRQDLGAYRPVDIEYNLQELKDSNGTKEQHYRALLMLGSIDSAKWAILDFLASTRDNQLRWLAANLLTGRDDTEFLEILDHLEAGIWTTDPVAREHAATTFLTLWTSSPGYHRLRRIDVQGRSLDDLDDARAFGPRVLACVAIILTLARQDTREELLALLGNDDPLVRCASVTAIHAVELAEAADQLVQLAVADSDSTVRIAALEALPDVARAIATPALTAAIGAEDFDESWTALDSLALVADPAALPPLANRLATEQQPRLRAKLLSTVLSCKGTSQLTDDLVRIVSEDLHHPEPEIRDTAASVAGHASLSQCSADLLQLAESDPSQSVRSQAMEAYGQVAPPDALLALVDSEVSRGQGARLGQAIAYALLYRDANLVDRLQARIRKAGGRVRLTSAAVHLTMPFQRCVISHELGVHDTQTLLTMLTSRDPATRWRAAGNLMLDPDVDCVVGRVALATLDKDQLVAEAATESLRYFIMEEPLGPLDPCSISLLSNGKVLRRLIRSLDPTDLSSTSGLNDVLTQPAFLPALLEAADPNNLPVSSILWSLAERHELRFLRDGTAVLPTGRIVRWADLPAALA